MNFPIVLIEDCSITEEGAAILAKFGIPSKIETKIKEILISSEQELKNYCSEKGADGFVAWDNEILFVYDYEGECNFSLPFKEVQP